MRVDGYAPIRDYAAIGDGRTVALVARDGSIDWLCFPDFDSPSAFGALVDAERGGSFQLEPEEPYEVERRYLTETNVLETTFTTSGGSTRITDAMTVQEGGLVPWRELARRVEGLSGSVPLRWRVEPRFGFGHDVPTVQRRNDAYVATAGKSAVAVQGWDAGHPEHQAAAVAGRFTTERGSRALLALTGAHEAPVELPLRDGVERRLGGTAEAWRRWLR